MQQKNATKLIISVNYSIISLFKSYVKYTKIFNRLKIKLIYVRILLFYHLPCMFQIRFFFPEFFFLINTISCNIVLIYCHNDALRSSHIWICLEMYGSMINTNTSTCVYDVHFIFIILINFQKIKKFQPVVLYCNNRYIKNVL